MKILLLTENWPPQVGGIQNYLFNIARYLPGSQVTVVAPWAPSPSGADANSPSGRGRKVMRARFFWPLIRPKWLPLFIRLWRKAKREQWDVTLCGKALFEGLVGYYLKKHLGIPYVVFTYAMEIDEWAASSWQKRKLIRVLKAADRVVYINDATKQQLLDLGVSDQQLVKIWPGVPDELFRTMSTQEINHSLEKYAIRRPYILTVARLVPRKGIDLLVQAFASLDQVTFGGLQLVIVGEGPERDRLAKLATQEWINTSIKFLGVVPEADLPALYAGAEVFALTPTRAEGFGMVYGEAAAQGVPALATLIGGAQEAVWHKETGAVVQPVVAAIKEGLEYLLGDPELRARLGQQARMRAVDQFMWSKRITLVKGMLDAILMEGDQKKTHASGPA